MKTTDKKELLFDNRALVSLIVPLFAEQLLTILVGLADSVMIASVGEAAVSGVSLVDNAMVLIIQIFAALAAGGAVVAGQYLGLKKNEEACRATHQLLWTCFVLAVLIMGLVYIGRNVILHVVFGRIEADVAYNAEVYLLIVAASIPFIAVYNWGAAIFRAMGNSAASMAVSLFMNVINVVGNAALIYGFHRGTEGVAIPTLVSRMFAAAVMVALLRGQSRLLHIPRACRFRPDWMMIRSILRIGIPSGLENSMFQLGKLIVLSLVSSFGTYAIAANAVGNAVGTFQWLSASTISLAVVTVVSRCVGARDYEQARYYTRKLMAIAYVSMWIVNAVIFAGLPWVMNVYHLSARTSVTATRLLWMHGGFAMLIWPISFTLPNVFRAAGDVRYSMIVSTISMWTFRVFCSYLFGQYLGYGVVGVWAAMIVDWFFRSGAFIVHYVRGKWTRYRAVS